jgi:hypothetical protein
MTGLIKNADGDDFVIWHDAELKEWRAEQWNGLDKNYLHLPAILHAKSKSELLSDVRQHRSAS